MQIIGANNNEPTNYHPLDKVAEALSIEIEVLIAINKLEYKCHL